MIFVYVPFLLAFALYSYSLVDPNITLINSPVWERVRESAVQLGYYHRDWSWIIYLLSIVALFMFHRLFMKHARKYNPVVLALIIGLVLLIAYPFLSHDFFNYLFDAKILTLYHKSPYLFKALDFPHDPWIRFMHWTHRTYPYGPLFLVFSIIPSFISGGKFIADYFLFKLMFTAMYVASTWLLSRIKREYGLLFATHPLVIIEALVNGHNDIVAVTIALVGMWFLLKKNRPYLGGLFLILSSGIKYMTLPFVFISKKNLMRNKLALAGFLAVVVFLLFYQDIQPWYFLNLFVMVPFFASVIEGSWIFLLGLLVSYYPFVRYGEWINLWDVPMKQVIVAAFLALNVLYLIVHGTIKRNNKSLQAVSET